MIAATDLLKPNHVRDLHPGGDIQRQMEAKLAAGEGRLVLDLSKTAYLDSESLGMLVGVLSNADGRLTLALQGLHDGVSGSLQVSGLLNLSGVTLPPPSPLPIPEPQEEEQQP